MEIIGTVISTEKTPSSGLFRFVIKGKIPVRKGQFVQLKTEEGLMLARVSDIIKTNRYFMFPESVKEYESSSSMANAFPIEKWEYLVAEAVPLGIYVKGTQHRVGFPPSPGTTVTLADSKILSEFLGLDENNGVNIGSIATQDIDAKLNITKLFQKHLAILAISGAGKSYTVGVLIEELLDRSEDIGSPAIIVVDPHGEYLGFAEDKKYASKTRIFGKDKIKIGVSNLTVSRFLEFLPQMSKVQRRDLGKILSQLKQEKKSYNIVDIVEAIEKSDIDARTKEAMTRWLEDLRRTKLFGNVDAPSIEVLARFGELSILDLSDFIDLRKKQIIVAHIARKLFNARRQEKIPPFIFIVEEAHQFAPEGVEKEASISKGIIETIAREGRKFNASLVLISQRPIQLSTTALSQCNTHIIMRVTNPYDLEHIGKSSEGITRDVLKIIPGLKVGEALIVGEAVNYPLLIKVRKRKSKVSEKGMKLEEALSKYKKHEKAKKEDVEAFM
jgi:hypothetical protein